MEFYEETQNDSHLNSDPTKRGTNIYDNLPSWLSPIGQWPHGNTWMGSLADW